MIAFTFGAGLNRFAPETEDFAHYTSESGNPRSLLVPALLSLYEDRSGALWITTQSGVSIQTGTPINLSQGTGRVQKFRYSGSVPVRKIRNKVEQQIARSTFC